MVVGGRMRTTPIEQHIRYFSQFLLVASWAIHLEEKWATDKRWLGWFAICYVVKIMMISTWLEFVD